MMGLTNILNALFMVGSTLMTLGLRSAAGWSEAQLIAFLGGLMLLFCLVLLLWQPYWLPLSLYRMGNWLGRGPLLFTLPVGPKLVVAGPELGYWPQLLVDEPLNFLGPKETWWSRCQPQDGHSQAVWVGQGQPEVVQEALAQGKAIWLVSWGEGGQIQARQINGEGL